MWRIEIDKIRSKLCDQSTSKTFHLHEGSHDPQSCAVHHKNHTWSCCKRCHRCSFSVNELFLFSTWRRGATHAAGPVIKMLRQGFPCMMGSLSPRPTLPVELLTPINRPYVFNHVEMIYLNVRQCVTSLPFIFQNVCVLCWMINLSSDNLNMTN